MLTLRPAARFLSAIASVFSILGAASQAQAAVVAIFDPAFGPTIPNLGFRGSITLDVTPGCYQLGTGFFFTGGNCQITPLQAEVDFYNSSTNPNNILTAVPLDASFFAPGYVFGAYFDLVTGQLSGIDTNDSNIFSFSVMDSDPNFPVNYNGSMVLYFVSGQVPIQIQGIPDDGPSQTQPGVGGAFLRNCLRGQQGNCVGTSSNSASLTFVTIPEPDSIALALLGLGALVVTRRRKPRMH